MNKRAFILSACLGTLILSAAKLTAVSQQPSPTSSSHSTVETSSLDSTSSRFELLRTVYGSSSNTPLHASIPPKVDESTLWLARAIYSETKVPHEQELVGWVVRNRVETGYRGSTTYREAVLDPYQFSAFNPGSGKRTFLLNLTPETQLSAWRNALWTAYYIRHAEPIFRPFSQKTRHFYSERSMQGRRYPVWVNHRQFVSPTWEYELDARRFRFYEGIS